MADRNLIHSGDTSVDIVEELQIAELIDADIDFSRLSESQLRRKCIEAMESNFELEKVIKQLKVQISDIVTTNNKFISILAHDLRNPMSSILSVLALLTENVKLYDGAQINRYLDIANHSANHTLSLLDNMLVWISTQHQGAIIKPIKLNLNTLLLDEIENISVLANHKQITLQHHIAPQLVVMADEQMVRTIIRNLLSNAVKFTGIFGVINVSAIDIEYCVEITIDDTGIGVSSEGQKNLFKNDSFYSTIGTQNEKGTGLGLLICKEFVELNGGKIWFQSKKGKGSEFKFILPHGL